LRHCQRTCSHTPPGLGPSLLDRGGIPVSLRGSDPAGGVLSGLLDRGVAGGLGLLGAARVAASWAAISSAAA
jgi:hypothetical protein